MGSFRKFINTRFAVVFALVIAGCVSAKVEQSTEGFKDGGALQAASFGSEPIYIQVIFKGDRGETPHSWDYIGQKIEKDVVKRLTSEFPNAVFGSVDDQRELGNLELRQQLRIEIKGKKVTESSVLSIGEIFLSVTGLHEYEEDYLYEFKVSWMERFNVVCAANSSSMAYYGIRGPDLYDANMRSKRALVYAQLGTHAATEFLSSKMQLQNSSKLACK